MKDTRLRGLYAITDPELCPHAGIVAQVEAALRGGARLIQYRNKDLSDPHREQDAEALATLCGRRHALLLINDDIDLAVRRGAHGVHLGQGDADIEQARRRLGKQAIIGVTCHASLELAREAQARGADYVAFGRFFPSRSKPQAPPADIDILRRADEALDIPICAIGGITPDKAGQLRDAGADMLAVIHGLFGQQDVEAAAGRYVDEITKP